MSSQPVPPAVRIRPMRLEDIPQVQAIDKASFSMPWPESAYRYELSQSSNSLQWVAEGETGQGWRIVGMIVVWVVVDEAHIATIAVQPEARGQGIARQLMAAGLSGAILHGAEAATLEVRAGNLVAQRLYRRFHFEVVGNRPRYYRDNNEDALIMTAHGLDQDYLKWLESGAWSGSSPAGAGGAG